MYNVWSLKSDKALPDSLKNRKKIISLCKLSYYISQTVDGVVCMLEIFNENP